MGTRVGEMPCLNPACTCKDVAVEATDAGTLQAKCHKCGCPTFGKRGTAWRRTMEGLIRMDDDAAPPKAAAAPAAAPPAAPARRATTLMG